MVYSVEQKSFMIESYFRNGRKINGEWSYSIQDCLEEFRVEFPAVAVDYKQFRECLNYSVKLFRETGSIKRKDGSGRPKKRTPEIVDEVEVIMENQPKTSLRHLSQQVNLSVETCRTILKKDLHLYPYRITAVQELLPGDLPQRLQFCEWFFDTLDNNNATLNKTFFTDEAWFYKTGYINSQNMRMWSAENPHLFVESPLNPEKIGVWAAFSGRRLIGPIFFEGNINAARYREEILRPFFEQLDDDELREGYFQQDGATPHCTRETLDLIREFFDVRVISRNTETPWPPRSCDLTPCDFFLWPYLKNNIFSTPVVDLNEMRRRITEKFAEINNNIQMLQNVINGVRNRVRRCQNEGGGHFQHLL